MFGKYNSFLILLLLLLPFYVCSQQKFQFQQPKMGSPFTITIYGKDSVKVAEAAKAAFHRVDILNAVFSDYMDSSELNKLSRTSGSGKYMPVSAELFHLLKLAKEAARRSGGTFDITIGPVVSLWRKARRANHFPDTSLLKKALELVDFNYIHLNEKQQSVRLEKPGMQLDLGGIAKGYIAQSVLDLLRKAGFPSSMVNAGGDLALGDAPPDRAGWNLGISIPEKRKGYLQKILTLTNKAVATSGDIYQFLEWEGKHYSHIINPKTGMGVTTLRNVTVIADDGATADWLASACSILPLKQSFRLIRKFPGSAILIAEKRGDYIYKKADTNFMRLWNQKKD